MVDVVAKSLFVLFLKLTFFLYKLDITTVTLATTLAAVPGEDKNGPRDIMNVSWAVLVYKFFLCVIIIIIIIILTDNLFHIHYIWHCRDDDSDTTP